ncbi:MAG: flagellar protein FlgN [Rubellimicrobium sp.]|nr:flagellar protein FlgN [Rubellimicrobium sp.]
MPRDRRPAAVAELENLLARERAALRDGRLDDIGVIGDLKHGAMARLERQPPDPATLAALRALAGRNARLLEAALAGLRDGAARLQAIRAASTGFHSYDGSGRTGRISGDGPRGLERRA